MATSAKDLRVPTTTQDLVRSVLKGGGVKKKPQAIKSS